MARQHEERPHWPYKNADGRKKDEEVFLSAPIIKGQLVGAAHITFVLILCKINNISVNYKPTNKKYKISSLKVRKISTKLINMGRIIMWDGQSTHFSCMQ